MWLPFGSTLSPAAALVAVWMMATFASFRSREIWELLSGNGFDAQVQFQSASWLVFGLIACGAFLRGRFDPRPVSGGPLFWYAIFVALAVFSTVYSPAPMLTGFGAMQLAVATALICTLVQRLDVIYPIIAIYVAINWLLVILGSVGLDFGLDWIAPAQEVYARFGGAEWETWRFTSAFGHPSLISIVAAMGAVGLAAKAPRRQWALYGFYVVWLAATVVLTVSRTAILGMLLGFLVVAWRRRLMLPFGMAASLAAFAVLIVPDVRDGLVEFLLRGQTEEDVASLTGRTDLYATAMERLGQISFGEGFRAVRANLLDEENWGQGVSHAHNLVLEALISLGVPGAAAVLASLISFAIYAARVAWHPWYRRFGHDGHACEALAVLFPILAFCTLDSGFAMNANPFVITFIFFAAKVRVQLLALDGATAMGAQRRPEAGAAGIAL